MPTKTRLRIKKGKTAKQKITKEMSFSEVLQRFPASADIFIRYGMHCLGCVAAQFESIEAGAAAHGIDTNKLVAELNRAIATKKSKRGRA